MLVHLVLLEKDMTGHPGERDPPSATVLPGPSGEIESIGESDASCPKSKIHPSDSIRNEAVKSSHLRDDVICRCGSK